MHQIYHQAKKLRDEVLGHRRFLHQCPEVGFDLPITKGYVMDELHKMSYQPREIIKGGILCELKGQGTGKTILLRGDMDGFQDEDESTPHHICGHDCNTAILLGTAKLLKYYEKDIEGHVKFMFQPAEEITKGAKKMMDADILVSPKVDMAMSFHMISGLGIGNGKIIIPPPGPNMLSIKVLEITSPSFSKKFMSGFQKLINQLNTEDCQDYFNDYINVYYSSEGPNKLLCSIRSYQDTLISDTTHKILGSLTPDMGVTIIDDIPPLHSDDSVINSCKALFNQYLNPSDIITDSHLFHPRFRASDDMALILREVPGTHLFLTSEIDHKGTVYPLHHPSVILDDENLYKAVAAMSLFTLNFVGKENVYEDISNGRI